MNALQIKTHSYRLGTHGQGEIVSEDYETPSGRAVAYHVETRDLFTGWGYKNFPPNVRPATIAYSETIAALLDSGI